MTMPLEIITIPCLSDNYAFLLHAPGSGLTALVDAPEAAPIEAELNKRGWGLDFVFLTHHHWDHIDALEELQRTFKPTVVGAQADVHRLPPLDLAVKEGTVFSLSREDVHVIEVPGHTVGHIAFYLPESKALFTADSLMALGCGRLFEGTAAQMWNSLNKLAALPADTMVYSGHEYTQSNGAFALTIEPDNSALQARVREIAKTRAAGESTVPSLLSLELDTNPFLRAGLDELKRTMGMEHIDSELVFKEIRERKDQF
ncbi:hydroxyacylglutathione hydrolase [Parasedimentitalea huanghaiensis]|uniref:Hydroxyacylglutathione hydrolase n=1 Tax=Parasedimentitalea huanghaiensis TaxID=2682100 RepID=A0A6L6WIL0_9RHOB|nr:hydroxyacylglutathione hydrolase [Zongyanglinia huanghaiensis]MVO17564.1 hydroxyacylglutathione hydrolase [Zongyanglinia huanghaiensis]